MFLVIAPSSAQQKRAMTFEDVLGLKSVSDAQVSPDGKWVAYVVTSVDMKENANDEERRGFSIAIQLDDPAEAGRIFHALAENGTVTMPIQKTFWTVRFGMLVDRFGVPWMVNCERAA